MKLRKITRSDKGQMEWGILFAGILVVGLILVFGGVYLLKGKDGFKNIAGESGDFDYTGKNVDYKLDFKGFYNGTNINPVCYLYNEQPADWENGRVDIVEGYEDSETASSGQIEYSNKPGDYYARCQLSGYYDGFGTFKIPSSGDVSLSEYNDGGELSTKIRMRPKQTLSTSNLDLGVSSTANASATTLTGTKNFAVSDNYGYCLSEVRLSVDSTYDFTTTLTNGDSEEGVDRLKMTIEGVTKTLWDKDAGTDEFGADNEYRWEFNGKKGIMIEENDFVDISAEFKGNTSTVAADADGSLGNAEDLIDDIVFYDCDGTTATLHLVG